MNPTPQFAPRRNCQVSGLPDTRQRPSLRHWLRRYRYRHGHHAARTFHELDPVTGHWRRL